MDATLSHTTARISFTGPHGKEITRPSSDWIVERPLGTDRVFKQYSDNATLAKGEQFPFELVLNNANGSGTYCATRTADLTMGEWEARISLISGSDVVEGVIRFTIFPDNDLEWEQRKFVLRRKG
jgi:hypothetical protein